MWVFMQTHLQEPEFFWFTSNAFLKRPVLLKLRLLCPFLMRNQMQKQYHKRTTLRSKSSTLNGLLYVHDPEKHEKGTLSNQPQLSRITSTALLWYWGRQSLKDMTFLGTDFEMHAIWQGYVEEPAANDFVARKAHTMALSKVWGTQQSTLFMSLEIPRGFHTRAVLCSLARLMSRKKVSVQGF